MIKFLKNKFGPTNCDNDTLMKRMYRATKINNKVNFYGCCGSWSVMAAVPALIGIAVGLPWVVPVALFAGGAAVLGSAIPVIRVTEKIENAFNTECRKRGLWKPEWDEGPPDPGFEYERSLAAKQKPVVLAEVFDPAAAITLGSRIKAMPAIKLKTRHTLWGARA